MMTPATDDLPGMNPTGTLLVVDDDESNRDLLSRRLERRGHTVLSAEDGRQALELVASRPIDLMLLDMMMPDMSGLEVLETLREKHAPTDLAVIMATACDRSEAIVESLRKGANDYVTKPLDFPVVLARIRTQLVMKRAVEEAVALEKRLAERNRELEVVNARLEAANKRIVRDLDAAAKVQGSFLPPASPSLKGARCSWCYRPCDELAGDGLNAFPLDDRHSAFYLFDVCGHGVASALLSVSISRALAPPGAPSSVLSGRSPAELIDHLNRMFPFHQADQYFTMVYGVLNGETGELRYVSAGHPGLIHIAAAGSTLHDGRGFPVGLAESRYEEQTIRLSPGDRVYFYSDGISEAMDETSRPFGQHRLMAGLEGGRGFDLTRSVHDLVASVDRWHGEAGARDDVSILGVEFLDAVAG